jgi:hypothetical protein
MEERDVDVAEPEPLEAGLQRAPNAIAGEVEDRLERAALRPYLPVAAVVTALRPDEHAPDLRRHDELGARPAGQRGAQAPLREARAVQRGGIERAHASVPRGRDRRSRLGLAHAPVQPADRGAAEGQPRDLNPARSQFDALHYSSQTTGRPAAAPAAE